MKTYCKTNTCSPQYTTKTLLDSPKTTYYFHKKARWKPSTCFLASIFLTLTIVYLMDMSFKKHFTVYLINQL